jgi:anti-sigma regulatory factor (Ser/Thr protein kinase)
VPPDPERSICVTIRNDIGDLVLVRDALKRFGVEHAVGPKTLTQLQVTLDEIVSNIIKYAWPAGGAHELSVRMSAEADSVCIEVIDDGRPFDPRSVPAPHPNTTRRRARPGGLGIHMVRQLVDEIAYRRTDDRNHVLVTKRCGAAARTRAD